MFRINIPNISEPFSKQDSYPTLVFQVIDGCCKNVKKRNDKYVSISCDPVTAELFEQRNRVPMMRTGRRLLISLTVAALYISGILFAIEAALKVRTEQGAIAWAVSLVTMPLVAVPAYLVLGRSKFEGVSDAFESRRDEFERLLGHIEKNLKPWEIPPSEGPSWHAAMVRLSNMPLTRGNHADLLINGNATFDSILRGVASAEEYILFQFYMIHDDGLGQRVKAALIDRARAGVRVYVLYDEIGSSGLPSRYVNDMRSAGIEVSSFKPTQGSRNQFQLNFRNHRKMVVVDGETAWVGGHNVGDEYLGLDPEFSPWRDTHVRLQGPVVIQLQMAILGDWYWATRQLPEVNWTPRPSEEHDKKAMIFPFAPTGQFETASLFFVAALNGAKERIWLSAPYFVPDAAVMKALQLAALRGVDVRIITTGKPDSLPVYMAAFHYMEELAGLDIRFYAYQPGFLHEKVMLIDDNVSTVGTPNFDNRSFRLNFEVTSVILDREFAREMEDMFERDFEHSKSLFPESFATRSLWWRGAVKLARLAAPVL
nr:cardiolipin synthase [Aestuariicella hydrocarbonica]